MKRLVIIAPHPDDEVLGAGGTMARTAAGGGEVFVVIVTRGMPPEFDPADTDRIRQEACAAHALLGVRETLYLDFPAAGLDGVRHSVLNKAIHDVLTRLQPDTLMVPFPGDIHMDHQRAFHSAMVAVRPHRGPAHPRILAYETLSETNWYAAPITPAFVPTVYLDLTNHLDAKLRAMACYASQVRPSPHERSVESLRALAMLRGSTVGLAAAEAFVLVREVI
jgi:LmbE family N-acetylglucosaminyl deacetylase